MDNILGENGASVNPFLLTRPTKSNLITILHTKGVNRNNTRKKTITGSVNPNNDFGGGAGGKSRRDGDRFDWPLLGFNGP